MNDQQAATGARWELKTGGQKAGLLIFVLVNCLCADEMVPGWGMFHLDWPPLYFYLISIVGGGIGGALLGRRYILPGLIGGVIAGPGALYAVGKYLGGTNVSHSAIMCLFGVLGALPGIAIGILLGLLQERIMKPQPPAA